VRFFINYDIIKNIVVKLVSKANPAEASS
jgi:hypothetical protein